MFAPLAEFIGRVSDRNSSTAVFSFGIFIFFALLDAAVDRLALRANLNPDVHTSLQAAAVGLAACLISIVLLKARREQREIVRKEMQRVIEVNHRLRNSLQVISYAQDSVPDPKRKEMMIDAVRSMDTALKQLFPTMGIERRGPDRPNLIQFDEWK